MSLIRSLSGRFSASALLALTATSLALAQTQAPITVFSDDFSGGSTVNKDPVVPAAPSQNATAYQVITNLAYPTGTPTLEAPTSTQPGKLRVALDSTAAGRNNVLAQALFSQYPVKLAADQDWIELTVTFTAETALLVDSLNTSGSNSNALYFGLYGSSGSENNNVIVKDDIGNTDPTKNTPLSAYVHEPNQPAAGGQIDASNDMRFVFPKYWKGYTGRILRTGGRHQAWYQNSTGSGQTTGLQPTQNSTLASLVAGQKYTATVRITRVNVPGSEGIVTTRLLVSEQLYVGATAEGTPLVSWVTTSAQSGSNHMGVVYDALAMGLRVNTNGANGTTEIMAINSVKVVTTGKTLIVPAILDQPDSQNASWGDPASFTVVAAGGGDTGSELSYQWKKNGIDIAGETSASYTIPELDYSHAGTYTVVVTNSVGSTTSAGAVLVVNPPAPPTIANLVDNGIDGNPVSLTVASGSSASFTVTGVGAGLSYKWQKSTDGTTFTDIAGATSRTYTIARTQGSSAGQYRAVVMNSSGSATSAAATLSLIYNFTGITPSGYGSSATGGSSATPVEVNNVTDFKAQAESASDAVITVSGTIDLGGKVSVKSNKTIQGKDGEATIIGNLELTSGVSNVIIRGLNITNPAGKGLTITGASNVYLNHLSFYNCSETLLAITGGANNVTVSWSEFYYTAAAEGNKAVLVGAADETKPINVTFDHNWWSDNTASHMPDTTYGRVHMYNNLFRNEADTDMGNTSGTLVRANAQLFSERNQYTRIQSPLTKEAAAIGLVRTLGNTYSSTSGTSAHAGTDFVTFAPPYSYQLMPTTSVTANVAASAGNLAGASTATPVPEGTASVTSTAGTVPLGGSFTLTAVTDGLNVAPDVPVAPYQWRLNGTPIGAATTNTSLTITGATGSNTGYYTVAVLLANGDTVISEPTTITTTSGSSLVPSSESEAAGGGGAPSAWFLGALALLATLRRFLRNEA